MFDNLFNDLQRIKILVVGDIILDEYLLGNVERISPEAPVPILNVLHREYVLGGAANVATNITNCGSQVELIGMIGSDAQGELIIKLCQENPKLDIQPNIQANYFTTTKTRVFSQGQQLLRIDQETKQAISAEIENKIIKYCHANIRNFQICILSDYAKGVLTDNLLTSLITICRQAHIPVIVDPKGSNFSKYRGATILTPNLEEAKQAAKSEDATDIEKIAAYLHTIVDCEALLITKGANGLSLFKKNATPVSIATTARHVQDVKGAGDTIVAILALCIAAGADIETATTIANRVAGFRVEKLSLLPVSLEDIKGCFKLSQPGLSPQMQGEFTEQAQ